MKVLFNETDRTKILAGIKEAMGDRKLAEIVRFEMNSGTLEVIISKLGTSTLTFKEKIADQGIEYALTNEKIAFTHKAFKDEVTNKILSVIKDAGGKVT
jgi:hypothetical protein